MKRSLLPTAFLLGLLTYSCTDAPVGPSPQTASLDKSGVNPSPPHAANAVRLNLSERLKLRPTRSSSLGAAAAGSVVPASRSATLKPGQSTTEAVTINLPSAPPKGDVLFMFDLTGSMGGALNNLRLNAVDIMNAVSGVIPDAQFGLVSHEDYPGTFTTSSSAGQGCNYGPIAYGSAASGDLPYRLDRSITGDRTAVANAISGMLLKNGADLPESFSRALYETYADASIAWRSGAKRVVVSFGDDRPHDCTLGTGNDPGRDGLIGGADDLAIANVLNGMKSNGITLVSIHNGTHNALWNGYAAVTGGTSFQTSSNGSFPEGTDPATTIASLISGAVSTLSVLRMEVCSANAAAFGDWLVSTNPVSYTNVALGESRSFDVVIGPPAGRNLENGAHEFDICAMGDGVEYGRQHVTITADGTTTFIPAGSAEPTTVTVEENGKAVAGARFPAGTFDEAVSVTVRFVELVTGARCHDFLLAQTGRCLEITAVGTGGLKPTLQQPVIAGLCLPEDSPPLDLFKFESRTDRPLALQQTAAPFLDCAGFRVSSAAPTSWLKGLALGLAKSVGELVAPRSLYAAHSGFGGLIPAGGKLSLFTWASPIQVSYAALVPGVTRSGKDLWVVRGAFNMTAKNFAPFLGEAGFASARDAVTVGFGKNVYTIPVSAFRFSTTFKRWVFAAQTTTGITAMEINPLDGTFTVGASVPTEGALPAYRSFSLQVGHRAQGVGLLCDATRRCRPQEQ